MAQTLAPGQIIILNGAPRSGKSSIVEVIQGTFDGVWTNLGSLEVDTSVLGPQACATLMHWHLDHGPPPSAFRELAAMRTT